MRYALYRITAPILDRIPDISHQPKGRQMSIGLAASLLFHLLLLGLALLFSLMIPKNALIEFAKAKPKLQEIEVTILQPEPQPVVEEIVPLAAPVTPVLSSAGLAASEKPPENPVFQSGVDMKAASELPAKGDAPLPTQKGRVDPDVVAFANPPDAAKPMTPPPAAEPPAPEVPKPAEAEKPPSDLKEVPKPADDQIALGVKSATPAPTPKPLFRNSAATRELAMLTPPSPPKERPAPEQSPTEVEGDISNLGKAAASSVATPFGKYFDNMTRLVDSRWKHYIRAPAGGVLFPPGSVRITVSVDRKGKLTVLRTSDNTSTTAFARVTEKALLDTKLPPPPTGSFDDFPDGKFTHTIKFTLR